MKNKVQQHVLWLNDDIVEKRKATLEALHYSNHVMTKSSVKKLDDAKIQLEEAYSYNKKIMLKERWTKSEQLQIIRKVKSYGRQYTNSLKEKEQTRAELKQKVLRNASKSGKITF